MADEQGRTFEDVHERLSQIVDEVSSEDISLDEALKLYEEAVKLGLSACDLSEQDIEAYLATEEAVEEAAEEVAEVAAEEAEGADASPAVAEGAEWDGIEDDVSPDAEGASAEEPAA